MKLLEKTKSLFILILNLFFPIKCIGCDKKDELLCNECFSKVSPAERETERDIIAVFDYRDPIIKKAIWELKYHHKKYLGEKLGQILYDSLIEEISELKKIESYGQPILVIPVPISKKRNSMRGYNQAISIAQGFIKQTNKNILKVENDIVYRKIETSPQAKISNRAERLKNVRGIFDIKEKNKPLIRGRTCIVIDDVTTTGGTIAEIMKILKKSGAKKVIGFAVAH